MKKLNLNRPIVDAKGDQIDPKNTLSTILANALMSSSTKSGSDILRYFTWAKILGQNKELEINEADAKTLKTFIEGHENLFVIVKSPIIEAIDNLKF